MRYNQKFRVGIIQGNKGIARPGVIDEFMQELAGEHFDALGHDDTKMHIEDQKAFIISRMTVELYEEVEIRTVVDGYTWVSEGKAANFPRNYEIQQDGVVKARGAAVWALVDLANERLIRAKDFDIGSNFDEPVEEEKVVMGLGEKFRIPKDAEFTEVDDMKIQYWQTDINRHMNNVRYIDPMWSAIPGIEDRKTKAFSIYYQHEAAYGERVKVSVSQAYPCDIEVDTELAGLINNNYSPETDEIFYVTLSADDGIRTQSMWVVSKL